MKILVLQGPNLNFLGRRQPEIYGTMTLAELHQRLKKLARELKVDLVAFQSNSEGALLDVLYKNVDKVDGALVNPAGLTQFSVSLHDAIKSMPFPVIEVHMTNRHAREEWRHHSIISSAVKATVEGFGWRSYTAALRALVEILREKKK
jgi:3-dehydroquinate dehydratase-2